MKIALVISTFPPQVGGMGQVALSQALGLVCLGHEVSIFTLDYGVKLSDDRIKIHYLKPVLRLGDAGLVPQLFFKLRGFDLVHLHFPFYGGAIWVYLASIFWHFPYVSTYHMDAQPNGWFKKVVKFFADRLVGGLVLKKSKKIIVVDKSSEQFSLLRKIKPQNLIQLNNGVDVEVFVPRSIIASDLNLKNLENKNILLFVGNLMAVKRLDLVLQAMYKLNDKNLVLVVVGSGYEEKKYRHLVEELSLQDKVTFVGKVNSQDILAQYYSLADITIIPSDYESFSLVAIESLACGTPIIGSSISALKNKINIGDNGLLFAAGDSNDLAQKIKEFFSYTVEQRERFGKNSRNFVLKEYGLQKNLNELVNVYKKVI